MYEVRRNQPPKHVFQWRISKQRSLTKSTRPETSVIYFHLWLKLWNWTRFGRSKAARHSETSETTPVVYYERWGGGRPVTCAKFYHCWVRLLICVCDIKEDLWKSMLWVRPITFRCSGALTKTIHLVFINRLYNCKNNSIEILFGTVYKT